MEAVVIQSKKGIPIMKETFGERFKALRRAKGLTQEAVAVKLNISGQAVSKWENDLSAPDISILPELADLLGVTVDQLLGRGAPLEQVNHPAFASDPKPALTVKEDDLMLRIRILSNDNDKVAVNLPLELVRQLAKPDAKGQLKISGFGDSLSGLDFGKILRLASTGVLGHLLDIKSQEGDLVSIAVVKAGEETADDDFFRTDKAIEQEEADEDEDDKEEEEVDADGEKKAEADSENRESPHGFVFAFDSLADDRKGDDKEANVPNIDVSDFDKDDDEPKSVKTPVNLTDEDLANLEAAIEKTRQKVASLSAELKSMDSNGNVSEMSKELSEQVRRLSALIKAEKSKK